MKIRFIGLALASVSVVCTSWAAGFADFILDYNPGLGFAASYTNASVVLGAPTTTVHPFNPAFRNTQLVSVGTNGYLTVGFSNPIRNDPANAFGLDFLVFGNAGFIITNGNFSGGGITDGSLFGNNPGNTCVSVSQDNVTYYQLNPALTPTVDGPFPTDGLGDFHRPVNPALIGADFAGKNLAGIHMLYDGSGGGTGFDIAWAQDADGKNVTLATVSFIRIDVLSGKSEIDGFSVVPEPTPWTLACLGATLLGCAGWRRFATKKRLTNALLLVLVASPFAGAATYEEDFSSDPSIRGWQVFGQTNLFRWNVTNQNLEVTWDSSKSNSFFYRPLGTVLSRADNFSVSFNLRLADIAVGVNTNKPDTFQITLGFINLAAATRFGFLRGTGTDSPNLVEFDYFPDSGFGATVASTLISSNNVFGDGGFTFPLELTASDLYHVAMNYTATNRTLSTIMTRNGVAFGPIKDATLGTNFTDFRVDHFAVCSYSDAEFAGSVLAHGIVDDITVTVPELPVTKVTGGFKGGLWRVEFSSQTNWLYALQRTMDLVSWVDVSPVTAGTGSVLVLQETNSASASSVFYRVKAEKP